MGLEVGALVKLALMVAPVVALNTPTPFTGASRADTKRRLLPSNAIPKRLLVVGREMSAGLMAAPVMASYSPTAPLVRSSRTCPWAGGAAKATVSATSRAARPLPANHLRRRHIPTPAAPATSSSDDGSGTAAGT